MKQLEDKIINYSSRNAGNKLNAFNSNLVKIAPEEVEDHFK